jgi:hypothetical protein
MVQHMINTIPAKRVFNPNAFPDMEIGMESPFVPLSAFLHAIKNEEEVNPSVDLQFITSMSVSCSLFFFDADHSYNAQM